MIVIDDALRDTAALRSAASTEAGAGYGPDDSAAYPGVRAPLPRDYVVEIMRPLFPMLYRTYGISRELRPRMLNTVFSLIGTPPERLSLSQRVPHFDASAPHHLAVLHYLAEGPFCGTGFFRHRPTGFERIGEERVDAYVEAGERYVARHGEPAADYIVASTGHYELIDRVDYRPNRLLVYPGGLLHSGLVDPARDVDADPRTGRLTANIFVDFH